MQARNVRSKKDGSNIIGLGAIAKAEKKKDSSVINSTTGMLYTEEGKLFSYSSVDKAINLLTPEEKYAYFPTGGTPSFKKELKKWVFGNNFDKFDKICEVIPTPGGTGALSNIFANYLNDDDYALLPNYMWTNYIQILDEQRKRYQTYDLFDEDDNFNIKDIKDKALNILKDKKRVLILINDPAQNPTGYTLKKDEIDNLIKTLNELKDYGEVVFVIDAAYIDYADTYEATRANLAKYYNLDKEIITLIAFSASKSFGLYGLRVGALLIISKNEEVLKDSYNTNVYSSRAKWSNTSSLGISLVTKILENDDFKKAYLKELNDSRLMLKKRSDLFKELIKKNEIKILPYEAGFFSSIPFDNPDETYQKLIDRKVHLIPFSNSIRITLASINLEEIKRLIKALKEVL